MYKSYEEMKELAVKAFGSDVEIYYSKSEGWTIQTQIEERAFDWSDYVDTPAYQADKEFDGGETVLERWARKNGHGYHSMHEVVLAYNDNVKASHEAYLRTCRKLLERQGVEIPEDDNELMRVAKDELDKIMRDEVE